METLATRLRAHRQALGLRQSDLARAAGIGLATLQNVEAGRANPSLATLEPALREAGLVAEWRSAEPDWDALAALGLPLAARGRVRIARNRHRLVRELGLALIAAAEGRLDERQIDALRALLLALDIHFPAVCGDRLKRSPVARSLGTRPADGRVVKLYRIARATLAEYL